MRVLAFILSVLVATALTIGGIFAIVEASPHHPGALIALPSIALSFLIYGPLLLGSLRTSWSFAGSRDSQRYFLRAIIIVVGVQILAAAAVIVYSVIVSAPLWLPVSFIVVGALLTAIALVVGRSLQRREERVAPHDPAAWIPISREAIVRKIRKVAITFVAAIVVGVILVAVLDAVIDEPSDSFGSDILTVLAIAFIAAGSACALVSIPITRMVRESAGRDVDLVRKIAKVVLRGKPIELNESETLAASRYANVMTYFFPFQFAYVLLLYVGLGLERVQSFVEGSHSVLNVILLVLYVALLVALAPLSIRRFRRARAYAREHTDLLNSSGERSASQTA